MIRKIFANVGWKLNFQTTRVILLIAVLLISIAISLAEESNLPVLKTKTKTVAIFKNGLGFFIRDGSTQLKDGWAITEFVPNSTLGSIWISSLDKDVNIESAVGLKEEIIKEGTVISIDELLKTNIGNKAIITYGDKIIEGKIKSVPDDRQTDKTVSVYDYQHGGYISQPQLMPSTIVIIETNAGDVVLNKSGISRVDFPSAHSTKYNFKENVKKIKFKISSAKSEAKISLSYLQKGIMWMPAYLINIEDPSKAKITMQANLINDAEDLENADVSFVVGYPNFMYANVLSPLAMQESVMQFVSSLAGGRATGYPQGALSNVMTQSVTYDSREASSGEIDYNYETIQNLEGTSEEDLFFYNKKDISLKKGERAYYHIFYSTVDYKHIYEWDIPNTMNTSSSYYQTQQTQREQVWHSIKLINSTAYPWTTAPAFVVSGSSPVAQSVINYTPKGAKTDLRLTIATDIKTDRHENEIDRQREVKIYRQSYDLVTVEGELYIKNLKDKDITMEIKKNLTGEVIEASHNGKIVKIAEGLQGVNYNSNISWEVPVGAGKEITVKYKYKVYVSN